jgi:hypothetical protein
VVPPISSSETGYDAEPAVQRAESRMILIVGTDVHASDEAAAALFRAGHIPVMAEWFAFPLFAVARGLPDGHSAVREVLHPISERLLDRCDSVLRMNGHAPEADEVIGLARSRGLRVHLSLREALDA